MQDPTPSRGSQAPALKDASSNGELYQVMYSYASLGFLKHLKAKLKKKKEREREKKKSIQQSLLIILMIIISVLCQ